MSKASSEELGELHGAIARGLTEVITQGEVIDVREDGGVVRKSASAAFFMAGITMLKNNNVTADPTTNEALTGLSAAIAKRRERGKGRINSMADAVKQAEEALDYQLGGMMQ